MDPVLNEVQTKIQAALDHLKRELSTIRAGRANPSLLEEIPVNAYGAKMKIVEVGTISSPQPSLLTIQVWDPSIVKDVEKAVQEANLGLNASTEGQTVRVPIPPLTEERRLEFVKLAHQKGEECKVEIRQIRSAQREDFEEDKKSGNIGEDEFDRLSKELQNLVDKATLQVEQEVKDKEADLLQI